MKCLAAAALLALAAFAAHGQDLAGERERIRTERTAAEKRFADDQRGCYRQFAVNDCLHEARQRRSTVIGDLRRQEIALNEAERKRRSAERQRQLDERTAPEAQDQAARRRSEAVQARQQAEARGAEKSARREAERANRPAAPAAPASAARERKPGVNMNRPQDATEARQNRERFEAKQAKAEAHRKDLEKKAAERKKPIAAPLPPPPQ